MRGIFRKNDNVHVVSLLYNLIKFIFGQNESHAGFERAKRQLRLTIRAANPSSINIGGETFVIEFF